MSFLGELLAELIGGVISPESPRGWFILSVILGCGFVLTDRWLFAMSPDPWNEPSWSFGVLTLSILYGSAAAFAATLYLVNDGAERGPAVLSALTNTVAVALPILGPFS